MVADVEIAGRTLRVTCVSMGNPHVILFVDRAHDDWVFGRWTEGRDRSHFPRRVNVQFVQVRRRSEVRMRAWERGSGETLACGTGACAVCVAGALGERTERKILAHLPGGDLELHWAEDGHVYMTGPAVEVFSGEWESADRRGQIAPGRVAKPGVRGPTYFNPTPESGYDSGSECVSGIPWCAALTTG